MKTVTIEDLANGLNEVLAASHDDRVLVKSDGKPVALVIDVREKDEEQIRLENDPEFWRMIQKRRQEPTVPWKQVKKELNLGVKRRRRPAARKLARKR